MTQPRPDPKKPYVWYATASTTIEVDADRARRLHSIGERVLHKRLLTSPPRTPSPTKDPTNV